MGKCGLCFLTYIHQLTSLFLLVMTMYSLDWSSDKNLMWQNVGNAIGVCIIIITSSIKDTLQECPQRVPTTTATVVDFDDSGEI